MNGLLFLNGQPPSARLLESLDYAGSFVVCADGAYNYLHDYCQPDILVGDFDSLDFELHDRAGQAAKKIVKLDTKKDFTDGHIAMQQLLEQKPDKIFVYGATGRDPDHQLANYSLLLLSANQGVESVIVSSNHKIYLAQNNFSCPATVGKRVSLVPFSDAVHILSTTGLKYPIRDEVYGKLHIKGISNVALSGQIGFLLSSGTALVFVEI